MAFPVSFTRVTNGERQGSATAVQLPTVDCRMVKIKAQEGNAGQVYIGGSSAVTVAGGTTDTTSGYELSAGEDTGWLLVGNLNLFYMICDNAGDDISYLALG